MDNTKKNVHSSGPLGMLIKNGQITKIADTNEEHESSPKASFASLKSSSSYFKTQSGIEFSEQELVYVDPKECEPWTYANRQENEFGDIDELITSIRLNKQLQPALIRYHPKPHDSIKYEIIFGQRRHIACLKLGVPFLAIRKDIPNIQDAIASQDAENKLRNDVSNYSNAILYKKLLSDGVFKTEKELADKLNISTSSLNDLMAFAKIPLDIVKKIPNVHILSKQIAIKIVQLLNESKDNYLIVDSIASELGKSVTSNAKLEHIFAKKRTGGFKKDQNITAQTFSSGNGKKLFTLKSDYRGLPSIVFNKEIANNINLNRLCEFLTEHLEEHIEKAIL